MILRVFGFTMPALGHQGTILPSRIGFGSQAANRPAAVCADAGVRVWNDVSVLGYGEAGHLNAKGASLG